MGGSHHAVRNIYYLGRAVDYSETWALPGDGFVGEGVLEFDFCSVLKLSKKVKITPERTIDQLVDLLNGNADDIEAALVARFNALKEVSHRITVSAKQLHDCCKPFPYEKQ